MEPLQRREKEIFAVLRQLRREDFVLIGGYAVNAYALPRFSVDCDIVVRDRMALRQIREVLAHAGFAEQRGDGEALPYGGKFVRAERDIGDGMSVSMDILMGPVLDRQSGVRFDAEWIFANSVVRTLPGKTISDILRVRIINPEALVVMKWICARGTDIRDVFMLLPMVKDRLWVKGEICKRHNFSKSFKRIMEKVTALQFRDNLQGVYGYVDTKTFAKHQQAVLEMEHL